MTEDTHRPNEDKRRVSWEPETKFEEGIKRTIDWHLENKEWIEKVITGEYLEFYRGIMNKEVAS